MFQKFLRLLGLGAKVDAIGAELDVMRDAVRDVNDRMRKDLALDDQPKRLNGRPRTRTLPIRGGA
jgi:hypothetical protein